MNKFILTLMKKLTAVLLFVAFISTAFAQTEKGKFLIAGSSDINFTFLKTHIERDDYESDPVKTSSFELNPLLGYFLNNNFAVGIESPVTYTMEKQDGDVVKSKSLVVGPFARVYLGNKNVKPFVHGAFGFGKSKDDIDFDYVQYPDQLVKTKLSVYEIAGGLSFFLNERFALELSVSYGSAKAKFKDYYNQDIKSIVRGISADLGFAILL